MKQQVSINESNVDQVASNYERRYGNLFEAYVNGCARTAIGESVSNFELAALGVNWTNSNNTANSLKPTLLSARWVNCLKLLWT